MGIPVNEQETVINFNRDGKTASIYTSDSTVMTKLDKLVDKVNSSYRIVELHTLSGDVVAKTYECNSKRLISFRAGNIKRVMSEEQRQATSVRMKQMAVDRALKKELAREKNA